jgi:hypothetical protein
MFFTLFVVTNNFATMKAWNCMRVHGDAKTHLAKERNQRIESWGEAEVDMQ